MTVFDNVKRVRDKIAEAALSVSQSPDDILLVAASKTKPPELIRQAIAAGVDAVGENRVQELIDKNAAGAYSGASLHFIGHLQKNKVKQVVGVCDLIQSAGSVELIELINKRAMSIGICQDILVEVNIGKEVSKSGLIPEEANERIDLIRSFSGIRILGLMAIPPIALKNGENRRYFEEMYKLFVDIKQKKYDNVHMKFLSLGMSGDFEDAIISGANMIRLGSAIFGSRD